MDINENIMHKVLLLAILIFSINICGAESVVDKGETTFSITKCLIKKTATMCAFEELLKTIPSQAVEIDSAVTHQPNRYIVSAPNSDWLMLWPDKKSKTNLELMHQTGNAQITVSWHEGESDTYKTHAREPLKPLIEKLSAEPEKVELDIWPFDEVGAFYSVCYNTNKETQECFFSAAANMPNGVVHFLAITEYNETSAEEAVAIIASVDAP